MANGTCFDLAIVGAGAAGLAAAHFAADHPDGAALRILLLEGARKPGAKILVSGGGRCNVTNRAVTEDDFFSECPRVVRRVLKAFPESATLKWFDRMGIPLKLEPTGKYFPASDSAKTVLDALLKAATQGSVTLQSGMRVTGIAPGDPAFRLTLADGSEREARRVILATGGLSLPKSGSDGWGLEVLRGFGHRIVPMVPALVPLLTDGASDDIAAGLQGLSGVTMEGRLRLKSMTGRLLAEECGPVLFTHFGLSGPAAMNLSRHLGRSRCEQPHEPCRVSLGHERFLTVDEADAWLLKRARQCGSRLVVSALQEYFPQRLAEFLAGEASALAQLRRDERLTLATRMAALPVAVSGDRGYPFAETTAGGVDLTEVATHTMESRIVPGLHLCGELLDADGRIGGFNFQWAWATGYLAGRGAAAALAHPEMQIDPRRLETQDAVTG